MNFESFKKSCEENPIMCIIGIVLLLTVVQNCVTDIGLGPWLGMDSCANAVNGGNAVNGVNGDGSNLSGPAPAEDDKNEGQLAVTELYRTTVRRFVEKSLFWIGKKNGNVIERND